MNMLWNTLRHRIWIGGGLAILTLGTAVASLTASRLQAQQDSAREQQRQADASLDQETSADRLAGQRERYESIMRQQAAKREVDARRYEARALERQAQNAGGEGIAIDSVFAQQIASDADRTADAMANIIARMRTQSDASRARWVQRYRRSEAMAPVNDSEQAELLLQYAKAKREKNAESQQSARDRLLELTRREFEAIEKERQAEIEAIEERLAKLKAVMEERAEKAELIIELRVKRLLGEPTILDWNASTLIDQRDLDHAIAEVGAEYPSTMAVNPLGPAAADEMESESPMPEEIEDPAIGEEEGDVDATDSAALLNQLREKESKLGTVGVGMASVYMQMEKLREAWVRSREEASKLSAEWEALLAEAKVFKDKGVELPAEYRARRAEIEGKFRVYEAEAKVILSQREEWELRVKDGETTIRDLQSAIDRIKERLEQLRRKRDGVDQE